MLLFRLHTLAVQLYPARLAFLILAVLGLFSGLIAAINDQDIYTWQLRLSLIFALWSLMLFAFITLFRSIPPPVLPGLSLFERARMKAILLLYRLLALVVVLLTLLLLQISIKLLLL